MDTLRVIFDMNEHGHQTEQESRLTEEILRLPVRHGGCGFTSLKDIHASARYTCVLSVMKSDEFVRERILAVNRPITTRLFQNFRQAYADMVDGCSAKELQSAVGDLTAYQHEKTKVWKLSEISGLRHNEKLRQINALSEVQDYQKVRLWSQQGSKWVNAMPTEYATTFHDDACFNHAIHMHSMYRPVNCGNTCEACETGSDPRQKKVSNGIRPDHYQHCMSVNKTATHDLGVNLMHQYIPGAMKEVQTHHQLQNPDVVEQKRRADLICYAPSPNLNERISERNNYGKVAIVDFQRKLVGQPSTVRAEMKRIREAEASGKATYSATLADGEKDKFKKYKPIIGTDHFFPVIVDQNGNPGMAAKKFFKKHIPWYQKDIFMTSLSVALQKGHYQMYLKFVHDVSIRPKGSSPKLAQNEVWIKVKGHGMKMMNTKIFQEKVAQNKIHTDTTNTGRNPHGEVTRFDLENDGPQNKKSENEAE
jgi:hypothetical protein